MVVDFNVSISYARAYKCALCFLKRNDVVVIIVDDEKDSDNC